MAGVVMPRAFLWLVCHAEIILMAGVVMLSGIINDELT